MFASLAVAAMLHTTGQDGPGGPFHPSHSEAHTIVRIVSHLPGCTDTRYSDCRYIKPHRTLASFHADGGIYYVVLRRHHGHRKVTHAEFYAAPPGGWAPTV